MKLFLPLLFFTSVVLAEMPNFVPTDLGKIQVQNTILTKINGKTISVCDVMQKMDLLFHKAYPNLIHSTQARYQFYQASWKHVLKEMVTTEFILADAEEKDLKVSDGDVREEMNTRFGPNVLLKLEEIGLSYDEAFKLIKTDIIVERMNWFFINSKALHSVTPQLIRQAYQEYLTDNPPIETWKYQVISIRSIDEELAKNVADEAHQILSSTKAPVDAEDKLKELEENNPGCSIAISNEYSVSSKEISTSHKSILSSLSQTSYSTPFSQQSRKDQQTLQKIFYLNSYQKTEPLAFKDMAPKLKTRLLELEAMKESENYFAKLRKRHGQEEGLEVSDDFQPFAIE